MSGKTITRREFLRGGVCALFGAAAVSVFGKDVLSPETARASESVIMVSITNRSTPAFSRAAACSV